VNDVIQADCTCEGEPLVLTPGQACDIAIPVTDGVTTSAGVAALGFDNIGQCATGTNSVWYSYEASCTGTTTVSSSIDLDEPDTQVHVYADCDSMCIATDDDSGNGFTSVVSFETVAGETYYIEWDDRWDDGEFDFEISCAVPFDCPMLELNIGDACDDGNPETEGDVVDANCVCAGIDPCPNPVNDEATGALLNSDGRPWGVPGWDTFDVSCATLSREACDGSSPIADSWYYFVAEAENQGILVRANPMDPNAANADMAVEVYDANLIPLPGMTGGSCPGSRSCFNNVGAGEIERCVPGSLTIGETYYYRVFDANGNDIVTLDTKVKTYADHPIVDGCISDGQPGVGNQFTIAAPADLYNIPPVPVFNVRMIAKDLNGNVVAMTPDHNPLIPGDLTFGLNEFSPALGTDIYTLHAQNEVKMHANGCVSAYWSQAGPGCTVDLSTSSNGANFIGSDVDLNLNFTAYPNPNEGDQVFIQFDQVVDTKQAVVVEIFDMYGKRVHSEEFSNVRNNINTLVTFDQKISSGMYFISLSINETYHIEKLVVE